jgi:hypothetical protein
MKSQYIVEMRDRSGSVASEDPLVSFLYVLMRDVAPPGVIEELVGSRELTIFTNGWLANYAKDIAERLRK